MEHGRGLDAPPGLVRAETQAPQGIDPARTGRRRSSRTCCNRDFTAPAPNVKWCGDMTEIPTDEGKLYLATVLDLYSRRLLACPTIANTPTPSWPATRSRSPRRCAAARRDRRRRLPHRPRLDLHRTRFHRAVRQLGIRQSMGRVGSCFDNAAAEAFFSTLEHEVLSRHHFTTKAEARAVVLAWCHDVLQHPPTAQQRGDARSRRVREDHR